MTIAAITKTIPVIISDHLTMETVLCLLAIANSCSFSLIDLITWSIGKVDVVSSALISTYVFEEDFGVSILGASYLIREFRYSLNF